MRWMFFSLVVAAVTLSACGGNRAASPIAVTRPTDAQLTCDDIDNEIASNDMAINQRRAEIDKAQSDRVFNGLAGGMIGASTSEDGSAARAEIDAYTQRTAVLHRLSRQLKC